MIESPSSPSPIGYSMSVQKENQLSGSQIMITNARSVLVWTLPGQQPSCASAPQPPQPTAHPWRRLRAHTDGPPPAAPGAESSAARAQHGGSPPSRPPLAPPGQARNGRNKCPHWEPHKKLNDRIWRIKGILLKTGWLNKHDVGELLINAELVNLVVLSQIVGLE